MGGRTKGCSSMPWLGSIERMPDPGPARRPRMRGVSSGSHEYPIVRGHHRERRHLQGGFQVDRFIKLSFVGLASMLVATGLLLGPGAVASAGKDSAADQAALKRDEDDFELVVAREDDDDDDDTSDSADRSRSNDRSRDMTSRDRSHSRDRSRDRTGDGVGVNDRSWSRDRSRDRTGDHNSRDVSRSRDVSGDQTSVSETSDDRVA